MKKRIRHFEEINESHEATGYKYRTDLPGFHIFTMQSTYPETTIIMPPYTKGFYQVSLIENSSDVTVEMDTQTFRHSEKALFFQAPNQVLSWVRGKKQNGYIIYFKEEFVLPYTKTLRADFTLFNFLEVSYLPVNESQIKSLKTYFKQILSIFSGKHDYRQQLLRSLLFVLLYECESIYNYAKSTTAAPSVHQLLAFHYQCYIQQYYIYKKTVAEYGRLLKISPGHLNEVVKKLTGKTALQLLNKHIIIEAKNLIIYTQTDIAEIAYQLGYNEPTHFGRFFKRETGFSPEQFRRAEIRKRKIG